MRDVRKTLRRSRMGCHSEVACLGAPGGSPWAFAQIRGGTTVAITSPAPSSVHLEGVPVPLTRLVLGTMSFGDTADEVATAEIFEAAMAAGITGVDTANVYAKGTTESLIAPHVRRYRDRIVLATKAGMPHADAGDNAPLSPLALRASVEGSL